MKKCIITIVLLLFTCSLHAQYDRIFEVLPEEYQEGIIIYVYPHNSLLFVFTASDYSNSVDIASWIPHITDDEQLRLKVSELSEELDSAHNRKYTVMQNLYTVNYMYFPNTGDIINLFKEGKIMVLKRKNDSFEGRKYVVKNVRRYGINLVLDIKTRKAIYKQHYKKISPMPGKMKRMGSYFKRKGM